MANRFNTPIASQAISAYAPVDMKVLLNELQMVQKRWDENEAFSDEVKKTIKAIPAMPGDVPFRDQLVSSLTNELNKAVSQSTDLGSSSFRRTIEGIYDKFGANADVKTLISNNALYTEKEKKKADLEKDGRYTQDLFADNESTRVDKDGKIIPYKYELERAFSDEEYLNPISKFANQLKANAQAGKGFTFDEFGNKYTFDVSSEGISDAQIMNLGGTWAKSFLNTDVGRQRTKRYMRSKGVDYETAKKLIEYDVLSYMRGNVFSKTSQGKDFQYAPEGIRKEMQEKQKSLMAPDGTFIRTGDYEVDNGELAIDSPEFNAALLNYAQSRGIPPEKVNKKELHAALNNMRSGAQQTGVIIPDKKQRSEINTALFGEKTRALTFFTNGTMVKEGTKLVQADDDTLSELEKNQYEFDFMGVDVTNGKLPGAIVVQAIPKEGSSGKQRTFYLPNTSGNRQIAESTRMIGAINMAKTKAQGDDIPIGGTMLPILDENGRVVSQQIAPEGTILRIRTTISRGTANSPSRASQIGEVVISSRNEKGQIITKKIDTDLDKLRSYHGSRIVKGMSQETPDYSEE
jgi:hypothetical protein